jgi:Protein of unknown function (DUF3040)
MGLSRRQQEILDQIERALQAADPRLKAMFAAFDKSARNATGARTAVARSSAVRNVLLIGVMLATAVGVLAFGIRATSGDCPGLPSDQVVASAAVRHAGCTDSTDAWSRGGR